MLKGNALIGQSGGPTSVINSSLVGLVEGAKDFDQIDNVLGMRWGIEGLMQGEVINLGAEDQSVIEILKNTPSSALGSSRHKIQEEDLELILKRLREYNVRYVFMIGGNDTMDTIARLEKYAKDNDYELIGIGVPKTVDNDLFGTDHTPGYPSAARYVALSVLQAGILARDMQKVDQFVIYQSIGRDAGWLTAAAAAAKQDEEDAPHLIYLPERPFNDEKFLADFKRVYDKYGWVSIACGEGVSYPDGTPVSASRTTDKFENIEFGAMGGASVAVTLHRLISDEFDFRGEFQVTESLPMSAADRAVDLDRKEAYQCGRQAVNLAQQGRTGVMVTLERASEGAYSTQLGTAALSDVAVRSKPMPDEYINQEGNFVTQAYLDYLRPLIGELPDYAKLAYKDYRP